MNLRLYLQTLRWNQVRLAVVVVASIGWGILIPIVYVQFAEIFKNLANSGAFPRTLVAADANERTIPASGFTSNGSRARTVFTLPRKRGSAFARASTID